GGGGGGGGEVGALDGEGVARLGAGGALLGGGLAVVDIWGVTLVVCSLPRDTRTPAITMAVSATAESAAAAVLVRYHGWTTRNRGRSFRAGLHVPISGSAERRASNAVVATSWLTSWLTSSPGAVRSRSSWRL